MAPRNPRNVEIVAAVRRGATVREVAANYDLPPTAVRRILGARGGVRCQRDLGTRPTGWSIQQELDDVLRFGWIYFRRIENPTRVRSPEAARALVRAIFMGTSDHAVRRWRSHRRTGET